MHPTELQGCKPVPQVGAPCHPETARAREQHPEARLWSNAPFEMVESFEPLRRWRGATNERHHDSGDERDTPHPHGYREDKKHPSKSETVNPSQTPTASTQKLVCGATRPSKWWKASSRSAGGEERRMNGITIVVTNATPPIHMDTART